MARVVVIGAGLGGLAVAARLATGGHDVVVCERAGTWGGKLGTFSRGGFTFDTGPSLLTLPAVYRDLFAKTGKPLEDSLELVAVDPVARYRFPAGPDYDLTWLDVPNAASPQLWAALDTALGDPRLRMLLDRYATYTGSDPRRAPAALAVVPYVEQTFGAWYVPGGLRRLGAAVYERAVLRGVTVRVRAPVASVVVESGRTAGVVLADGERVDADVVVSDADATHLYDDLLPRTVAARARRRLHAATP